MTKKVEAPNLKPLYDYLLIKQDPPEEVSKGGIVIPDNAKKKKTLRGTVLLAGPGYVSHEGTHFPMTVKVGESVIFEEYTSHEFRFEGEEYVLVRQQDCKAAY